MTPETASLEKNVRLFVWFRVLFNARFYYPIFAVFFTDMGLSVAQFLWLNVLWAVTIILFELPSGVLADLLGRRKLVVFSAASMLVEMLLLIVAPIGAGWWLFAVCAVNRVLSGMAEAAASGADEALAYDSVKLLHSDEKQRSERWDRVLVSTMRWRSVAMVIAMVVGASVFDHQKMTSIFGEFPSWVSLKLPVILCFFLAIACLMISLKLKDLGLQQKPKGQRAEVADVWRGVQDALSWVKTTKWIAAVILGGVIVDSCARTFITLQSSYFRFIDLPDYSYGLIGAGMSLSGWLVPLYVKQLAERWSPRVNVLIAGGIAVAGLGGVALLNNVYGILPCFLVMLSLIHVSFLLSRYINQVAPSEVRASILSVNSLSLNVGYGFLSLIVGLKISHLTTSMGAGVAFGSSLHWLAGGLIVGLALWWIVSRTWRKQVR